MRARQGIGVSRRAAAEPDRLDPGEAVEVTIQGEQLPRAVLPADGDDLGIEDQVAACLGVPESRGEELEEPLTRREDAAGGTLDETIERREGPIDRARRIEEPRMGDDHYELDGAEDGESPGLRPLGKLPEPRPGCHVKVQLFTVSVDEDVGVDGDQPRPSIRS